MIRQVLLFFVGIVAFSLPQTHAAELKSSHKGQKQSGPSDVDELSKATISPSIKEFIKKSKMKYPIKKVVVLMMENRAFDHMLGWMTRGGEWGDTRVDGIYGSECNPDSLDDRKKYLCVTDTAQDISGDPCHGFSCTTTQIYGCHWYSKVTPHIPGFESDPCKSHASVTGNPDMSGFVYNYKQDVNEGADHTPLEMWKPENIPVMVTLAKEFALFDRFFASHPGPTDPNRMFIHTGSAHGNTYTGQCRDPTCCPQKSIYSLLEDNGFDWRLYYEDNALGWFLYVKELNDTFVQKGQNKIVNMEQFYLDAQMGNLMDYTFIQPRWTYDSSIRNSTKAYGLPNDEHPPHSMKEGERLMKNVYESLRNGPEWNETLLIITYDEHGGYYDHVSPPQTGVPNPDGILGYDEGFNFTRLGIRIPTIAISPWIEKGTLIHEPTPEQKPTNTSEFELTSILATTQKIFGINDYNLSNRSAWAATFDDILLKRSTPRTDCPETLPDVKPPAFEAEHERFKGLPLDKSRQDSVTDYCNLVEPENKECGAWVKNYVDLGDFHREMDRKYKEKFQIYPLKGLTDINQVEISND